MRIQAQRETFASFRRIAFDWRPSGGPCPICTHDHREFGTEEHSAPLENGHVLRTWNFHPTPAIPHMDPNDHSWSIDDPSKYPEDPGKWYMHGDPKWTLADGGSDSQSQKGSYPTREHAQKAAEQAYQKLFPMGGGGSGGHDSGMDYSDLNSFKDHLGAADWERKLIRKNEATDVNGDSHKIDWGGSHGYATGEQSSGLSPKCSCGTGGGSGHSEASGRRWFTDHIKSIEQH